MGRHLSLLLILVLLVAGAVTAAAHDKKNDKEKAKAPAPSSDDSLKAEGYDPKELENDVVIKLNGSSSSCPDASEYDYEDVSKIMKTMTDNAQTAVGIENSRMNSNDSLEFVKVNKAEKRIGCGTYYLMGIKTKDHSSGKGGEEYELEYFVSDYEKHLVECTSKDSWSEPETNNSSKQNNGPCQEPSANKYEKVDKITKEVVSYANLGLLAQNIDVTTMVGLEKIEKVEKRSGCGTYYRLDVAVKNKTNGGKESSYELEYYQNKNSFKQIYFSALPPKQ